MKADAAPLHAFTCYGVELEYMIVDRDRLSVLPVADRLLAAASEKQDYEVTHGVVGWSNELVLHVVEIKNPQPVATLDQLPAAFQKEIGIINGLLSHMGGCLMPGAMHPWMDPRTETRLWPHQNQAIYQAYDRIFNSRGHGWANLQSMHVNLPFANDEEFARLHAAVRLVLPLIPALAASSPFAEGRASGFADYRMEVYRHNADRVPSIAGMVVPETISTRAEYDQRILQPMYRDIAALDPDQVLQHEWLNSRGAIARFDRNAIEIRVVDIQEHPGADLALAAAISDTVRRLYERADVAAQQDISTEALAVILWQCIRQADEAMIADTRYLNLLGWPGTACSAAQLWRQLLQPMLAGRGLPADPWVDALETVMRHGPLARRIQRAVQAGGPRNGLEPVYRRLCECLANGRAFLPDA
jgi:gamma-glutamyl:cysteine ligase YbdK (ATP-grasp superfamily)